MLPEKLVHRSSCQAASERPRGVAVNPRPQEHEVLVTAKAIKSIERISIDLAGRSDKILSSQATRPTMPLRQTRAATVP